MENISDEEFRKNVDKYIEEALLNEYYDKEKQLKDTREEKDDLQKEINKITIEKQETDKKISDMTDDIKVVKKQLNTFIIFGRRISSLLIIALLALVSILLDWNSLNTVSFTLAILGIIAGIVGIIGFLRNWNLALKTLLTISSILSLAAAIVTFKL